MRIKNQGVVLFHSTQAAIKAESALLRAEVPVQLIPTPRQLSADCGTALRFSWSQRDVVEDMLKQMNVEYQGIFPMQARKTA